MYFIFNNELDDLIDLLLVYLVYIEQWSKLINAFKVNYLPP